MRVLLDECIDEGLRHSLKDHDCQTCRYAGFKGLSNGRLLAESDRAGFDVLITVDKNMSGQQSLSGQHIALVILHSRTTNIEDVIALLPELTNALLGVRPGSDTDITRLLLD